jgi:hypothetical protein
MIFICYPRFSLCIELVDEEDNDNSYAYGKETESIACRFRKPRSDGGEETNESDDLEGNSCDNEDFCLSDDCDDHEENLGLVIVSFVHEREDEWKDEGAKCGDDENILLCEVALRTLLYPEICKYREGHCAQEYTDDASDVEEVVGNKLPDVRGPISEETSVKHCVSTDDELIYDLSRGVASDEWWKGYNDSGSNCYERTGNIEFATMNGEIEEEGGEKYTLHLEGEGKAKQDPG